MQTCYLSGRKDVLEALAIKRFFDGIGVFILRFVIGPNLYLCKQTHAYELHAQKDKHKGDNDPEWTLN